jgi:putative colanic acid biosynthesis glycosyltransferase WcaI
MGPIAAVWAEEMRRRGHKVEVVAAHPHYPGPLWGQRVLPYRELRGGIPLVRLPLWIGHGSTFERAREELTYAFAAAMAMGVLRRPNLAVVVSPAFAALAPMILNARLRRLPWILWLQDIFPDAAETTGLVRNKILLRSARRLEAAAYRSARRVVVISEAFRANLMLKGLEKERIEVVYNPAVRGFALRRHQLVNGGLPRVLFMGNIGYSQGVVDLVAAFELARNKPAARILIVGSGELAHAVRGQIRSDAVEMLGLVSEDRLDNELSRATLAVVSQRADIREFNLPSKLMTFMAAGVPILAVVRPSSETARLINASGAGWVADATRPDDFPSAIGRALRDTRALKRASAAGRDYARKNFSPPIFGERFDRIVREIIEA